jgi:hypothetical protein
METSRTAPTLYADVRRFSQLNNADKVFGTHRAAFLSIAPSPTFSTPLHGVVRVIASKLVRQAIADFKVQSMTTANPTGSRRVAQRE